MYGQITGPTLIKYQNLPGSSTLDVSGGCFEVLPIDVVSVVVASPSLVLVVKGSSLIMVKTVFSASGDIENRGYHLDLLSDLLSDTVYEAECILDRFS